MTIGEKILNMRKARGWNQEELAERIGVTRQAVSRWEAGSAKPDADKIIAICNLFGVSADYLLRDQYSGEESKPSEEVQLSNAPSGMRQNITRNQRVACGITLCGGLTMLLLKMIHVLKDTNYFYCSGSGMEYEGFQAFLRCEELIVLWYLALAAFFGGLLYLLVWPMIKRTKEKDIRLPQRH